MRGDRRFGRVLKAFDDFGWHSGDDIFEKLTAEAIREKVRDKRLTRVSVKKILRILTSMGLLEAKGKVFRMTMLGWEVIFIARHSDGMLEIGKDCFRGVNKRGQKLWEYTFQETEKVIREILDNLSNEEKQEFLKGLEYLGGEIHVY